jgi:ABC-type amino acid transport system permease subunit
MKFLHALLAIFLCQVAVPIGLLFSPWFIGAFMGVKPDFPLNASIQALDMTVMCWLISVPISLLVGLPLVLFSLIKNKLSTQRAFYINIFVSAFAIILLSLIFNWWQMWLGIAIPICFFGTAVLSLFYKNYLFIVRPIPMLSIVFMLGIIAFLFAKINIMNPHEVEMRSYMTLDREMAKRIEAERKK